MRQEMRLAREMTQSQKELMGAQEAAALAQASNLADQGNLLRQQHAFNATLQPHQLRQFAAESLLAQYQIPAARNEAGLHDRLGSSPFMMKMLGGGLAGGAAAAGGLLRARSIPKVTPKVTRKVTTPAKSTPKE
jgi:hypothetical protein